MTRPPTNMVRNYEHGDNHAQIWRCVRMDMNISLTYFPIKIYNIIGQNGNRQNVLG